MGWKRMTDCKRGDVVLVLFPNSDLITYKKRPALVVQADNLDTGLQQKIIAPLTSNLNRTGPTRVLFRKESLEGEAMGLQTDSVVVFSGSQIPIWEPALLRNLNCNLLI